MLFVILPLLERAGLIILVANLLMTSSFYRRVMVQKKAKRSILILILTFGIFAIISNFTGVMVNDNEIMNAPILLRLDPSASIANTRTLSISIAGLIGGPIVGLSVGLISGIVRFYQGGIAPFTYLVSSLLIGLISGLIGKKSAKENEYITVLPGMLVGVGLEMIQMLCIFIFYPSSHALLTLQTVALPMIIVNSLGIGIFLSIIITTLNREESMKAVQTHDVLSVTNQTLPFFRQGLNERSSHEAAKIICHFMKVSAVSITDKNQILAHIGSASDHHVAGNPIITELTRVCLRTGQVQVVREKVQIGCSHEDCPLEGAIVAPLTIADKVVGTMKFYFNDSSKLTHVEEQLASGLASIFSSQLELGQMESQQKLLKDAEIRVLQSQVNPHFFFNAINTINALIRIDGEKARALLLQLSNYFRFNLQGLRNNRIALEDEFKHLDAYLSIEQARFPNRWEITRTVDTDIQKITVPPFIIQVLVENAIKHAFKDRKESNEIDIHIYEEDKEIVLCVRDNGYGIASEKIDLIGKSEVPSDSGTGSALENLNKRLLGLYGDKAQFIFETSQTGTKFTIKIPKDERSSS